ncbi:unnamed protein product [Ectocarpus sp. 13 AM-2016]
MDQSDPPSARKQKQPRHQHDDNYKTQHEHRQRGGSPQAKHTKSENEAPPDTIQRKTRAASTVPPRWLLLYVVSILSALYAPGPLLAKQKITTGERTQTKGRPDAGETARENRQVVGIRTRTISAALKRRGKKTRHVINFAVSLQCTQREVGRVGGRESAPTDSLHSTLNRSFRQRLTAAVKSSRQK